MTRKSPSVQSGSDQLNVVLNELRGLRTDMNALRTEVVKFAELSLPICV